MHGLYLLWFVQEKGLSPAIVAAILAAGDLLLLLVEVPTGWFADRFGHRASLLLGSTIQTIGMLWCWFGEGVPGLLIASALVALGDGFRSGATQALLYRTCVALDREQLFQRIEARATAVETAALALLVVAGGVIVSAWGFAAGWLAEVLLCTIGLALAAAMTEPPVAPDANSDDEAKGERLAAWMRLTTAILPAALLGGAASAASFLAQTTVVSDPITVTWLVATITVAEAAGAAIAHKLPSDARMQIVLGALGAVCCAAGALHPLLFLAATPALALLNGLAHPLRATLLQRLASDDVRARIASLASACDMAISTIALPLAGVSATRRRTRRM